MAFMFLEQQHNQPNAHFLFLLSDWTCFLSKASIPRPLCVPIVMTDYFLTSFVDESLCAASISFHIKESLLRLMLNHSLLFCLTACDEQWQALFWVLWVWHHYWWQVEAMAYWGKKFKKGINNLKKCFSLLIFLSFIYLFFWHIWVLDYLSWLHSNTMFLSLDCGVNLNALEVCLDVYSNVCWRSAFNSCNAADKHCSKEREVKIAMQYILLLSRYETFIFWQLYNVLLGFEARSELFLFTDTILLYFGQKKVGWRA